MVAGLWGIVVDDIVGVGVREPFDESSSDSLLDVRPARRRSDCASRRDWMVDWRDLEARSMGSKGSKWWLGVVKTGAGRRMALFDVRAT